MYRHCIFCSADLGENDSIEEFPVGSSLAIDAWKGRLWAVCPRCERWNLAPIEERWEAVERAERLFRGTPLRVQAENIGLAELSDGTRLIRVGDSLPGELAAWRYGRQLQKRRRRYWGEFALTMGLGMLAGFPELPGTLAMNRVVHHLPPEARRTGRGTRLRLRHLDRARFALGGAEEDLMLHLQPCGRWPFRRPALRLHGLDARMLLERVMIQVNIRGAKRGVVQHALGLLSARDSAGDYIRSLGCRDAAGGEGGAYGLLQVRARWHGGWEGERISAGPGDRAGRARCDAPSMLALEMALHQEAEREAIEGELGALKRRWQQAEEIASIADGLPDDPLDSLTPGRAGQTS
jgi:hypothetical protein